LDGHGIGTKILAREIFEASSSICGGYQRTKSDRVIPCFFQAGTTNFPAETPILASDSSPNSVMVIFRRQTECKFQLEDMIQTGYAGACT